MDSQQSSDANGLHEKRRQMLETLRGRGFSDQSVLNAMGAVPREEFVADQVRSHAYEDSALPIACGQTISQPTIVAMMTTALNVTSESNVLEIGTGSGYQAAVLSHLASSIVSIERHPDLAARARDVLTRLDLTNVTVHTGDGSLGWPASAPYDRILVTAAVPSIPYPLLEQMKDVDGSRLVAPIGDQQLQRMLVIERQGGEWVEKSIVEVRFVPLRGDAGWSEAEWTDTWKSGWDAKWEPGR